MRQVPPCMVGGTDQSRHFSAFARRSGAWQPFARTLGFLRSPFWGKRVVKDFLPTAEDCSVVVRPRLEAPILLNLREVLGEVKREETGRKFEEEEGSGKEPEKLYLCGLGAFNHPFWRVVNDSQSAISKGPFGELRSREKPLFCWPVVGFQRGD